MYGLTLLSVALVAGQAAASSIAARSPLASLLQARQGGFDPSQIPAQCQSDCTVISTALNSATCSGDVSCLCSTATNTGLSNCLECALGLDPEQSALAEVQESYNEYTQACSSAGAPVDAKPLTIPSGGAAATQTQSQAQVQTTVTGPAQTSAGAVGTKTVVSGAAQSTGSPASTGVSDPLSGSGSGDGSSAAHNGAAGLGAGVGVAGVVGAVLVAMVL
ncbi:hypothetical protein OH77DRAFT_1426079 [Trametes cingulata]|nr:hypothetical protein OH77DRAFT_1426079 [Trametes cingulata]